MRIFLQTSVAAWLACGAAFAVQEGPDGPIDAAAVRKRLVSLGDDADPALVAQLGERRDAESLEVLLETYERFASVFMRREVVRALASFESDELAPRALAHVAGVAIEARHPALQAAALEVLAGAPGGARSLRSVVESDASEPVRLRALRLCAEKMGPEASEQELDEWRSWCEAVFEQAAGKAAAADAGAPPTSRAIANQAFLQIAPTKTDAELREAVEEKRRDWNAPQLDGVRRVALVELYGRDPRAAAKVAKDVFGDVDESGDTRLEAAKILVLRQGPKAAGSILDAADQATTPAHLREGLADLIAELADPATDKKLLRMVTKGSSRQKLFCIRALAPSPSEKVNEALVELLADDDVDVGVAAATALARRRATAVRPAVEEFVRSSPPNRVVVECIDTLASFGPPSGEWAVELVGFVSGTDAQVGHAAVTALAIGGPDELEGRFDALETALQAEPWSTRLAALHALEKLGSREAVGAIVERMQVEQGQMLIEFGEALWRMSGENHGRQADKWRRWWDDAGEDFERLTPEELEELIAMREERRLRQTTRTGFGEQLQEEPHYFGLVVTSRRVAFVLDVSGSMNELLKDRLDEADKPEPRIEVAKQELTKCIERLDPDAQFNVITFSGGVHPWLAGGVGESDEVEREEAVTFVSRLGAGGGTNLYDALAEAFADPLVNTVFVLSDGEPSVGAITDPATLRERVRVWNEHRGIVIHSIAVGGTFEILRWIAEDSGGTHVEYR